MKILSIDPGEGGGIAWTDGVETVAIPMPATEGDIIDLIRTHAPDTHTAFIEDVGKGVIPGRAHAMIVLNANFAVCRTALQCFGVRTVKVLPRAWQQTFSLGKRKDCASDTEWKNRLKSEAQRRFPHLKVTLQTSDCLLIMEWGSKQLLKA